MEKCPKVSVITVCLNSRKFLKYAIESVLEQTYSNIEYILIDGGSTDGSIDVFNKYKNKINKIVIEKDEGLFDAMNKGIKLAAGEIIYFLNSDDKLYDNKVIEKAVAAFNSHKEADFIYGNVAVYDPGADTSYIEKYPEVVSKWLFIQKTIGHPATFFRSSCFSKVGYFDKNYKIASDYEWYLRSLYINKLKTVHINHIISIFRLGGISTNYSSRKAYFSERRAIQKKYFNVFELLCTIFLDRIKILLKERRV